MALNSSSPTVKRNTGSLSSNTTSANTTGTNTVINKEVPNFWVDRGDGKPIAVDVYKDVKGAEALNAGGDSDGGFANRLDTSLAKSLKGAMGILGKVKSAVGIAATAKSIFSGNGSLLEKIGNISGLSKAVMSGLNIPEGSELYNQLTAATNVVVTVSGTARKLENVDWGNIQSVAGVLSEYTKDNDLFKISDLGVEGAFAATIINEAVRNGFPDSFEKVANTIGNSAVLKGVLGDILPTVMASSDLNNLKGMIDFMGGQEMNALFPGVVEDFTKGYKRTWWDEKESDLSRYQDFNNTMNALDTKWWLTDRATETIATVERIVYGSTEFLEVFTAGSQLTPVTDETSKNKRLLSIVSTVKAKTVEEKLKEHFPHVLFKNNSVTVPDINKDLTVTQ